MKISSPLMVRLGTNPYFIPAETRDIWPENGKTSGIDLLKVSSKLRLDHLVHDGKARFTNDILRVKA